MVSVKKYDAVGDGKKDDLIAVQKAIDNEQELFFPRGEYIVSDTIKVPSDRKLTFEEGAVIKLKAATKRKRGDFLLTNKNTETGDKNITIVGATFDGNNGYKNHKRPKNIFQKDGYSGVLINFRNVKNLVLEDLVLQNPVAYYTRFCQIDGFSINNIELKSKRVKLNQDGIHFAGEVRNGEVKNIRVTTYGQTNDDLIAINADDYPDRIEEFDTVSGTIENVLFENIYAESCHDGVRLLSCDSVIRNLTFRNLNVGFRKCAVECNAARGCRAELFKEEDRPLGVGKIERVTFENCTFYHTREYPLFWRGSFGLIPHPLIQWGSLSDDVAFIGCRFIPAPPLKKGVLQRIKNFLERKGYNPKHFPAFRAKFLTNTEIYANGEKFIIEKKEDVVVLSDFTDLTINSIK